MATLRDFKATKNELAEWVKALAEQAQGIGLAGVADNLSDWAQKIVDNRFRVLFLGDFKRGKSTTINALLGDKILPSDMKPCTGGITVIRHGDAPRAEACYWDTTLPTRQMSMEEFKASVVIPNELLVPVASGDGGDFADKRDILDKIPYRELIVYAPIQICRDGIELVDSPGLDEDKRRTELTTSYVPKADCGVFILAANQLLNEGERDNIKSFHLMGLQDLFFVVNFWDLVQDADDPEKEAHDLEERIRTLLPGEKNVFYVSSRNALRGKLAKDNKRIEASRFMEFESALMDFLSHERARITLNRYRGIIETSTAAITDALDQRRRLAKQTIEVVQKGHDAAQPRLEASRQRLEKIKALFAQDAEATAVKTREAFASFCAQLAAAVGDESLRWETQGASTQLAAADFQRCAQHFIRVNVEDWSTTVLKEILSSNLQETSNKADDLALDVMTEMMLIRTGETEEQDAKSNSEETKQRLIQSLVQHMETVALPDLATDLQRSASRWKRGGEAAMHFGANVAGGFTGAVIGSIVAPGIGTLVGSLVGSFIGNFGVAELRNARRHSSGEKLKAEVEGVRAAIAKQAAESIQQFAEANAPGVTLKVQNVFHAHAAHYETILKGDILNTQSQIEDILKAKRGKKMEVEPELKRLEEVEETMTHARDAAYRLIQNYAGA